MVIAVCYKWFRIAALPAIAVGLQDVSQPYSTKICYIILQIYTCKKIQDFPST